MAQTWNSKQTTAVALAVAALLMTACGRTPVVERGTTGAAGAAPVRPSSPVNEIYQEEQPEMAEQDPVEGPVNLPPIPRAPENPVPPSQMQVRALAMTLTNMPAPGLGNVKTTIIRARVTWTPVKGAYGYRVYQLAAREGGEAGKGKLMFTTPKWLPAAIVGGGMFVTNLNVGQEYIYTIEALDRAGNVMATGKDNCAPLSPLEIPYLVGPAQNEPKVGATPFFKWTESRGADGYYVEVFKTLKGVLPAIPMWRGFRSNPESMIMQYGTQLDVFEGTRPMQWSLPLNEGTRYAWTVCAVRTDTHNMHNAKAIAKATAAINYFQP